MANYVSTALAKAQAKLQARFQAGELRYREPVVFREYNRSGQIMMPSYEEIKRATSRTVEATYLKRVKRSLANAIAYNHSGSKGESGVLTPSWTVFSDKFKHSLKQANNNVYQLEEMVQNEVENIFYNFAEGLETEAIDHSFNNRSGVNVAKADGNWNSDQQVFEILESKEKRAAQIVKSMMDENKYAGPYTVFADPIFFNKMEFYANQGGQNSENLTFQFANLNFVKAIDLYDLFAALGVPYTKGAGIAVPEGMIAALPWIEPQYREGKETLVNKYSTIINPIDGLPYGVHEYNERSDESGSGGGNQDVATEVQVHNQIAFDHAPSSTANESPLMAFGIKDESSTA